MRLLLYSGATLIVLLLSPMLSWGLIVISPLLPLLSLAAYPIILTIALASYKNKVAEIVEVPALSTLEVYKINHGIQPNIYGPSPFYPSYMNYQKRQRENQTLQQQSIYVEEPTWRM